MAFAPVLTFIPRKVSVTTQKLINISPALGLKERAGTKDQDPQSPTHRPQTSLVATPPASYMPHVEPLAEVDKGHIPTTSEWC